MLRFSSLFVSVFFLLSLNVDLANCWSGPGYSHASRRDLLQTGAAAFLGGVSVSLPLPAMGAASIPSTEELERLRKGHARVRYLLDHWDEETQICGKVVMSDVERRQVVRTEGMPSYSHRSPMNRRR